MFYKAVVWKTFAISSPTIDLGLFTTPRQRSQVDMIRLSGDVLAKSRLSKPDARMCCTNSVILYLGNVRKKSSISSQGWDLDDEYWYRETRQQLFALLIHADKRISGVIFSVRVNIQKRVHPYAILLSHLLNAPHPPQPRLKFVFFSIFRTLPKVIVPKPFLLFNSSTRSLIVHLRLPAGTGPQTRATNSASWLVVYFTG